MGDTKYGTQEWETISDMVSAQANKLIGDKRFKSLIFDDIGNFSFAKEYLVTTKIPGITQTNEDEVRDELNRLKERYDKDPKFKKEVQEKWKESYTAEAKQRFDDMKERYNQSQVKDPNVPSEIRVQESKDKRRLKINKEAFVDVENEGQGRLADGTYIVKHESGKYYYTSTPSRPLDPENLPRMYELKSMKAANL